MFNLLDKKNSIISLIEKHHNNSIYSSKPLPKLIAVSKKQPSYKIKMALEVGQRIFGENKVQEAEERWSTHLMNHNDIELHFIGHLQTNKVKKALALFNYIHSLDRESLAVEISKHFKRSSKTKNFMIQVNTGEESNKSGILPKNFKNFFSLTQSLKLPVNGLMCIPPINDNPNTHFSLLKELADKFELNDLSMGMSSDFQDAIKFGATHVRIGTHFFGERL